jgi:epoxyqueuosine reductase
MKGSFNDWAFNDICQDVCPWNKFSKGTTSLYLILILISMTKKDWEEITEETLK